MESKIIKGSRNIRFILLMDIFPLLYSCDRDSNSVTLEKYAKLACISGKLNRQIDSIMLRVVQPLELKIKKAKDSLFFEESKYDDQIYLLNEKKYSVGMRYTEKYVKISKKHEEKHGHMTTPEFQKQIENIESLKKQQMVRYDQQIEVFNNQKLGDLLNKRLRLEIQEFEKELMEENHSKLLNYDTSLEKLKKEMIPLSQALDQSALKLKGAEKENLIKKREQVKQHP